MIDKNKPKLRNCPLCGKLFTDTGLGVCADCCEKNRRDEKIVIEYVREHPNSTIREICKETGAHIRLVTDMLRRGQFLSADGQIFYPCSRCGKPITHGIYCPQCIALLHRAIQKCSERAKSQERLKSIKKELKSTSDNTSSHRLHWMSVRDKR